MAILEIISAGAQATKQVLEIWEKLNRSRSCLLEIDNHTDLPLRLLRDHHEHGGFEVLPDSEIPPHKAAIFGSQSKEGSVMMTETKGSVTYHGDGLVLDVSWNSSSTGDNECNATISGQNADKFSAVYTCEVINEKVLIRYHLFTPIPADFVNFRFDGNPVLIQSRFGFNRKIHSKLNFELLVPLVTGGLALYWRDNNSRGFPWEGPVVFGVGIKYDNISMIQTDYFRHTNASGHYHLEVVARTGDRLDFFWRLPEPDFRWIGPIRMWADGKEISGVSGNPVLIQRQTGDHNFELLVPLLKGGLALYWCNVSDLHQAIWHGPTVFGSGSYDDVSMIESNEYVNGKEQGNLEVVARTGDRLDFFWMDPEPRFTWNGPNRHRVDGIFRSFQGTGPPVLIQSGFGYSGNFELVFPVARFLGGGFIVHDWRDNDDRWNMVWHHGGSFGTAAYSDISMIQSGFGSLEVVARTGDRLDFFWRDRGPDFRWNGPFRL